MSVVLLPDADVQRHLHEPLPRGVVPLESLVVAPVRGLDGLGLLVLSLGPDPRDHGRHGELLSTLASARPRSEPHGPNHRVRAFLYI